MYTLEAEASFDAAHFLKGYEGKCKNLHGHRWRMVTAVSGEALQESGSQRGMLVDFGDVKRDLKTIADELDHALLVEEDSLKESTLQALQDEDFRMVFLPFRTTAENLAKYVYGRMMALGYSVRSVRVYETPTNCAVYEED